MDFEDDSDWGSLMHWSAKAHAKTAAGAIPLIEEKMGWQPVQGWEQWPADKLAGIW